MYNPINLIIQILSDSKRIFATFRKQRKHVILIIDGSSDFTKFTDNK